MRVHFNFNKNIPMPVVTLPLHMYLMSPQYLPDICFLGGSGSRFALSSQMSSDSMLNVPVTKCTTHHRGHDTDETFLLAFSLRKLSLDGNVLQSKVKPANIFRMRLTSLYSLCPPGGLHMRQTITFNCSSTNFPHFSPDLVITP